MGLALSQLLVPATVATWRSLLLAALQGLGPVVPAGLGGGSSQLGSGSVSLSGTPAQAYPLTVLKISTAGELGAAQMQLSTDGGATFGTASTIPSNGIVSLGATGVTATFAAGPAGGGTSFQAGDTFSFALSVSTLPVTTWQSGGLFRTLVEIEAQTLAELAAAQAAVAAGGLTTLATAAWLDLLASNFYGLTRAPATVATVAVTLTAATGAGPYTPAIGALTVADSAGHRFFNTTSATLPLSGSVTLTFSSEAPGAAYNVSAGTLTTVVAGTLPGVTVSNALAAYGGADIESDKSLQARCQSRWQLIGAGATAPVYDTWAKAAGTAVTRTAIRASPTVAGQVDVYLASSTGPAAGGDVTTVTAYLLARASLCTTNNVAAANANNITVTGAVTYKTSQYGSSAAAQAAITTALNALINGLALGDNASGVKVVWSQVVAAIQATAGVVSISSPQVNGGTADVVLSFGDVAVLLANSCTYVGV